MNNSFMDVQFGSLKKYFQISVSLKPRINIKRYVFSKLITDIAVFDGFIGYVIMLAWL
jgi:predicted transcriptional regulator